MSDGLMIRVEAERADERRLERELAAAVAAGTPTTASYAMRFGPGDFGTFAAEQSDDPLTDVVLDRIKPLLSAPAEEEPVRVLASKPLRPRSAVVTKGLLLTFAAKYDHEAEVEELLVQAQPMAEEEPGTTAWYALQMANGDYGIFDVFPDRWARLRHLTGGIPRQLVRRGLGLMGSVPQTHLFDVVAATPSR